MNARPAWKSFAVWAILAAIAVLTVLLVRDVIRARNELAAAGGGSALPDAAPPRAGGVIPEPASASPSLHEEIAGTAASPETAGTSERVFRKASPSVVVVKVFDGGEKRLRTLGSGVAVGPETVVTNRHVVESGGEIRVFDRGQGYAATVLHADREHDLCTLSVPGLAARPSEMASVRTLRTGQRVYAIGAPKGLEMSISDGLVSALRPYGEILLIQTNAPISHGSSGGGLFDADGCLVGITTASAVDGQNINFALPADLVPRLPSRSAELQRLPPIAPMRRAEDIQQKVLLDALDGARRAVRESEGQLHAAVEEINRHGIAMNDVRRAMDDCLLRNEQKAYNELVPQYGRMNDERQEMLGRYDRKRREHSALVERHNELVRQVNDLGRLQP